ncbi:putative mucin TcMUCII [Trypanosoma cruzi]|uniref:Mucin TcMUCII, putative n=2 Tax=Trypanosoma cruzi TaxID=5693 RepID=Q4DMQ4_TRYCC|nr:mucin TcMUCII, putative [Trypanosoma cruzi]EAN93804.1 mucin TcMUCII, putative [Trypanosoma cruzi]PWV21013.1 putative mucin TcMUCII [Trypanosoma cruzi]|eukprot:XP_815655.1 mucin TcMUCII [Trypanosoma cruzi strain CL Brener]
MMTCRLLCALLVLALCCCCPSVCVGRSTEETIVVREVDDVKEPTSSSTLSSESQVEDNSHEERGSGTGSSEEGKTKVPVTPGSSGAVTQSNEAKMPVQTGEKKGTTEDENGTTAPKSQSKGSTVEQGEADVGGVKSLTAPKRQSGDAIDTVHEEDGSTTGPQSRTTKSADQTDRETKDAAATTTTTTTTTEAPTTTTTAPTAMTTRAPSRLREIDGSLSSSAWVCAPLVLAASALAYTAVG